MNTHVLFGVTEIRAIALKDQIVGALAFLMRVAAIATPVDQFRSPKPHARRHLLEVLDRTHGRNRGKALRPKRRAFSVWVEAGAPRRGREGRADVLRRGDRQL